MTVSVRGHAVVVVALGDRGEVADRPGLRRNVSPTTFTVNDKAAFLPVTYRRFVRGLNAGEPKLDPPWDTMKNSLVEYGQNMGRARLAFSGSWTIGNVAQNGVIGTPFAVYGYGCVGHTCSPGTSVAVRTGGLDNRIDRLAVLPVEEIQEAVLPGRARRP